MKPYKIFIFIVLIISALGVLCYFFPKQGVKVGNAEIRFPSLETVMVGQSTKKGVVREKDTMSLEHLESLKDTLNQYKVAINKQVGHFYVPNEDVTFFDEVFAKMSQAKSNRQIIRVLHYGDSQIEMDRLSSNLRTFFQSKFGGGGPGLVPVEQTIPSYVVSQYSSGAFTLYSSYGDGARAGGNYGLMGKCYRLTGSGYFTANASSHKGTDNRVKHFSNITLLYNDRIGNFQASLRDRRGHYNQLYSNGLQGIHTCHWIMDSASSSIQISMQGTADIYGIMLDNGYGVSVDNIPMRGCSGTQFTMIKDSILRTCYRQANVGLIILQFGGNSVPAMTTAKAIHGYCSRMATEMRYLKRCYPDAKILFIGPSDMSVRRGGILQTYPKLPQLVDSLRNTALRNGVAFWDLYDVMGGENSMVAWVENGLAGPDYIHFTPAGANKAGKSLADSFNTAYEFYLMRKKIDKEQFDKLWNVSER